MAILWTGPYSDTALPAGQRITGWSENTTGGGTLKNRYRDGDACSAFAWREMYGNINHQYAQSRRMLWMDEFVEPVAASTDPEVPKQNNNQDWTSLQCVYAVTPPLILIPNARRGEFAPPQLAVKVSARRSAGAADVYVRVYATTLSVLKSGWADYAANANFAAQRVQFTLTGGGANSYPGSPGWLTEDTITVPGYSWNSYAYPPAAALEDVELMETVLVIAGIGDGAGNGPIVRAIQVREEAPGG